MKDEKVYLVSLEGEPRMRELFRLGKFTAGDKPRELSLDPAQAASLKAKGFTVKPKQKPEVEKPAKTTKAEPKEV